MIIVKELYYRKNYIKRKPYIKVQVQVLNNEFIKHVKGISLTIMCLLICFIVRIYMRFSVNKMLYIVKVNIIIYLTLYLTKHSQ